VSGLVLRPWLAWAAGFAALLAVLAAMPFPDAAPGPWVWRTAVAGATLGLVALVVRLPYAAQLVAAWAGLLALFGLFFWSFQLSYGYIWDRLPFLIGTELNNGFLMGAALTLYVCAVAIVASTALALGAALMRLSRSGLMAGIATFYISFFRGTPLLLQILMIYLGLPQIGIVLDPVPSAIIALALCYGAYMAEIFRAGIQSIPQGQTEGARALGLHDGQIMWLVILPQAVRVIIPPTGNQFIAMLKDSSLVSTLGAWDLMYMARTHGKAEFKYIEMLIAAAIIYWVMSMVFEAIQARIERHFGRSLRR
jgi:polar amino acid transport system permease protein